MYTRCSHCKAIFRVTMKELTAAQGKLRCGECASVFNAMDSLSTKLPEQEDPTGNVSFETLNQNAKQHFETSGTAAHRNEKVREHKKPATYSPFLPVALAGLLATILASQVWLTRDLWFSARDPEKVKMLSRKVFTHPSQPEALIITGAIQNTAERSQPYPYLETRLLDGNDRVVALRRFRPHEYVENYQPDQLLQSDQQASIRLKILDFPGAKQFKFSFL